jgi:hypothetical protein
MYKIWNSYIAQLGHIRGEKTGKNSAKILKKYIVHVYCSIKLKMVCYFFLCDSLPDLCLTRLDAFHFWFILHNKNDNSWYTEKANDLKFSKQVIGKDIHRMANKSRSP